MNTIGIGLLGAGTVGGTLIHRLVSEHTAIATKTGLDLQIRRVVVRDASKPRSFELPEGVVTMDAEAMIDDPTVDLVVEVMGGQDPAGDLVLRALEVGKPVVTANKELIAARGDELIAAAEKSGVALLFEAAVGGGIPIIRPLSETLAGERLTRVMGIVNGTTNYILTRMSEDGASYEDALAQAQELGYAEPDPAADVEGADAAAKAAILASLGFGTWVGLDQVAYTGITEITATDILYARNLGYVIKLLGIAEHTPHGVSARVHPVLLPVDHPLSTIRGATNAIFIEGPAIDTLLFAGPGAGGEPTATAVLGDVIDAAREILAGAQVTPRIRFAPSALAAPGTISTKWYVRLEVVDEPGVLAQIAAAFGEADVSIKSVWQEGAGDEATLLIVTHNALETNQQDALSAVRRLDCVNAVAAAIRVESEDS